jgi:hypothetical protein
MWKRLKNILLSFKTYSTLSPGFATRQRVKRRLAYRQDLNPQQWYELQCKPYGISPAIAKFAYFFLAKYSGLPFSRVLSSDRLEQDLHWTEVCWFDWEITLCDDFQHCFGIDISNSLEDFQPLTIQELMLFLNQQIS